MSPDSRPEAPRTLPVLSVPQRRVLGVMVEKAKTTPDTYPMSLNALLTGCNQKSNREPVLNLTEVEVEEALAECQRQALAIRITGGRVERWRHQLYETWRVDKVELAILAELLLRGPQTEGELRGRASRMEPIDDLDALRAALRPMVERGLIIYLTPEGRRGTVLSHGFHAPAEIKRLLDHHGSRSDAAGEPPAATEPTVKTSDDLAGVRAALEELQEKVHALTADVQKIKEGLGLL